MKRFKAQMNSKAWACEIWTFSNILHYGIPTRKNTTSSKLILVFAYSSRESLCNKHNKRLFFGSDKEISFLGSYIKKSSQRLRDAVKTSFAFEFFQTVKMGKLITLPYRQQKKMQRPIPFSPRDDTSGYPLHTCIFSLNPTVNWNFRGKLRE